MSDQEDDYVIRNLAYELWERAGRPPGKHLDFWEQATRRIRQDIIGKASREAAGEPVDRPSPAVRGDENAGG